MVEAASAACPKCGAARRDEPACPRCGLGADRMATFASERDAAAPEPVRRAWDEVSRAWDDEARHDELFRMTAQHGAYAWTAAQYRDTRSRAGGTGAPERYLERVRRAAEATLLASATGPRDKRPTPYRSVVLVLALIVLMIVVGMGYAMFMRARGGEPRSSRPVPPASQVR